MAAIRGGLKVHDTAEDTIHGFNHGAIILVPIAIIIINECQYIGTTGVPAKIALLLISEYVWWANIYLLGGG